MHASTRRNRVAVALGAIAAGAIIGILPLMHADAATTVSRIEGVDRYATAANISANAFPTPGVPVAYLATGTNFPDALAAGPAAAKLGGPLLLTQAKTLPSATATELDRLNPAKIVVVGGTTAVSQDVMDGVQQYTAGTVTRINGTDRYDTAAKVSADVFSAGVTTVFVATGTNFPDALSGGAGVAKSPGGPLLLVQPDAVPSQTKTELTRLGADQVVVLGGTAAVSDAVKTKLEDYSVKPVIRRSGADRYLTSVDISSKTFTTATKVYLATGTNFPDALAGGPAAGLAQGPLLLTQPTCIPAAVNAEITRLNPDKLVILGGDTAVSSAVASRTECPATTTTSSPVPTFPGGQNPFCNFPGVPPTSIPGCP